MGFFLVFLKPLCIQAFLDFRRQLIEQYQVGFIFNQFIFMVPINVLNLQQKFPQQSIELVDRAELYVANFLLVVRKSHQILYFSLFNLFNGLDSSGRFLVKYFFIGLVILGDFGGRLFDGLDFEGFGLS